MNDNFTQQHMIDHKSGSKVECTACEGAVWFNLQLLLELLWAFG